MATIKDVSSPAVSYLVCWRYSRGAHRLMQMIVHKPKQVPPSQIMNEAVDYVAEHGGRGAVVVGIREEIHHYKWFNKKQLVG